MPLSFWAQTSGTWINFATVLFGTGLGLLLNRRLAATYLQTISQGIGLLTLWLGITLASTLNQVSVREIPGGLLGLLALVVGGALGEALRIEDRLAEIGSWLKRKFQGQGRFTEGFVAASLLFCVGPMALIGSLENGISGDNTLLVLKSTMDGIAALVLTSSYGVGVGFSALSLLIYQGSLSWAAGLWSESLPDPATDPRVMIMTGVGGLMIIGIGINLLKLTEIRVASFLPALALAPLLLWGLSL
ncbi:MAG: DUF554 domain-containing protein [Cyanobacteria bacterium P01_H01_bin.15]